MNDLIFITVVGVVVMLVSLAGLGYAIGPPRFRGRHEAADELRPALGYRMRVWTYRPRRSWLAGLRHRLSVAAQPELLAAEPEHVGATEDFGDELREMRDADFDPNLQSQVEEDMAWGEAFHEFGLAMQREIDAAFEPYLGTGIFDFGELRERLDIEDQIPTLVSV